MTSGFPSETTFYHPTGQCRLKLHFFSSCLVRARDIMITFRKTDGRAKSKRLVKDHHLEDGVTYMNLSL